MKIDGAVGQRIHWTIDFGGVPIIVEAGDSKYALHFLPERLTAI